MRKVSSSSDNYQADHRAEGDERHRPKKRRAITPPICRHYTADCNLPARYWITSTLRYELIPLCELHMQEWVAGGPYVVATEVAK
jgi:hypothetical protein